MRNEVGFPLTTRFVLQGMIYRGGHVQYLTKYLGMDWHVAERRACSILRSDREEWWAWVDEAVARARYDP